jgi:lipopolysaccharide export system protein LptA
VSITFAKPAATVTAVHGTVTRDPRWVVLERPEVQSGAERCDADHATLFLRNDNTVDRVVADGNVLVQTQGTNAMQARSERLELNMTEQGGTLRTAVFSGNVHAEMAGSQPALGDAGRVTLDFSGGNVVRKARAEENVRLRQPQRASSAAGSSQDVELTAPVVDFFLTSQHRLNRAETSGAAQITFRPSTPSATMSATAKAKNEPTTVVTAGKFEARFDDSGRLSSIHGAPAARIVSQNPGQPDRVSTSQTAEAAFHPGSGIESIEQTGNVAYEDGGRKAWGDRARYTPADQVLVLTGSPRVAEGTMTTTARTMRFHRATGEAIADGDVKTTYSDLKPQPNGALLSSSSPVHVTASSMTAHSQSAIAVYNGDVRLWQDANIVEAPSIEFDRNRRSLDAHASPPHSVSTILVETDKNGKSTPIAITSARLTYTDSERDAHFERDVVAQSTDLTITANQMDAFLAARGPGKANQASGAGSLDRIVSTGRVTVTQPHRQAAGDQLVYTAADDKFVLTGGPPSIFDAEHGKITGVSLTFFRRDDRVLVEGSNSSPTVTQTQVAR